MTAGRCLLPLLAGAFALGLGTKVEAQVCHGKLPFGPSRHVDVDVGASMLQGPTLRSGRSGFLNVDFGARDWFGSASVRRNTYSDYGYTTTEVDAGVGQAIELRPRSTLTLCPEADLLVEYAANLGPGTDVASLSRTAVASLRAASLHTVGRVPVAGFVGAGFFLTRQAESLTGPYVGPGTQTSTGVGGFAEVGAGLTVLKVVDVVIAYRIPVGLKSGLTSTTLFVGIAF
jgi:hypothetical protein